MYANFDNTCYRYRVSDNSVIREEVVDMYCSHEEADSRMFFHVEKCSAPANIIVA